jgi:hypothetical protein
MKFYVCSMANEGRGRPVELLTENVALLEKFAEDHDRPGRAVYSCPNPLKATATRRRKEEVAALVALHVDIDFKRLATPAEAVLARLLELPLPLEIRKTGGGFHVLVVLKEAYENGTEHYRRAEEARTTLTQRLCGDAKPQCDASAGRRLPQHKVRCADRS